MTAADPSSILARAGLWAAELRERGQIGEDDARRLNDTLAEAFGERLDQHDDPLLVVMLCGPTAVGKSSLINALAGAKISRPGFGAATRAAVLYVHEQDDPARLYAYSHALGSRDQPDTELVRHRRDELLHKVLVDTPDIDSVRLQHRELTARLVHAADLVLFVTSPEKYKVVRSARWVLEQRQQRAMAFVLNKWDRQGLGLQADRRSAIDADFRDVLAGEGFGDALVFKVSALAGADGFENDLPALQDWLEAGISQSTASLIRRRRLRAAWGRLAAAIEHSTPEPLSSHPLLPALADCLARRGALAEQGVVAEASILEPIGIEDSGWPATPGLLGMWTRTWHRMVAAAGSARATLTALAATVRAVRSDSGTQPVRITDASFGARHAAVLAGTVAQAVGDALAQGMALGPVGPALAGELSQLERQLGLLPLDVAAELATRVNRLTVRRIAGVTFVYAAEALIFAVLVMAVIRVGRDFISGTYAPGSLFMTVLMLVSILLILGQTIATIFFPPLRQRLRRVVARQARALVKAAVDKAQLTLREHQQAVDRLAREGRDLLLDIDRTVMALATDTEGEPSVDRLFAAEAAQPALIGQDRQIVTAQDANQQQRRPVFD